MSSAGTPEGRGEGFDEVPIRDLGEGYPEAPGRGARRRKVANYIGAAKQTWRSYQEAASTRLGNRGIDDTPDAGVPGAFPDVSIVRHGGEELILFPSYCKRHIKQQENLGLANESLRTETGERTEDSAWWQQEWEKFEDDKAIVDVDVRGWVYTPHRGPMNKRHRMLLGIARQLSGVPAPETPNRSRDGSPAPMSLKARHEAHEAQREEERIAREAEDIMRRGETEAEIAARGGYSEGGKEKQSETESLHSYKGRTDSGLSGASGDPLLERAAIKKRASWNQPSDMTPEQLVAANTNLMARVMPFIANPLASTPITVFFYDDKSSQSKTVTTNEAGHFNLRAALDFVPTHIRVLASENLSATEEVKITEPKGVSIITDVDDTIKHSSIGSGAREIFRNAFIRDLSDLTIDGVKEWYNTMYDMGVGIHYVSNSPWQLFPVLVQFFRNAGLPPGSYHLKQYSGMLQGIFEPVAERKKGTLERILRDFPERKFLLVGDSGEADLEVYTDIVLANPGRIIGVFIRDVTTPIDKPFFDESYTAAITDKTRLPAPVNRGSSDHADHPSNRPPLPSRTPTGSSAQVSPGNEMGDLIDLSDPPTERKASEQSLSADRKESNASSIRRKSVGKAPPPPPPRKPESLRSNTWSSQDSSNPISRKPSQTPTPPNTRPNNPLPAVEKGADQNSAEYSYVAAAKAKANRAYQAMPAVRQYLPSVGSSSSIANRSSDESQPSSAREAPPLPRRGITSTAASYAYSAGSKLAGYKNSVSSRVRGEDDGRPSSSDSTSTGNSTPPVNKKFELWKIRWARAKDLLDKQGVVLMKWRTGEDVADEAIRLVERNLREMGVEGYGKGKTGEGGGEAKVKDLKK